MFVFYIHVRKALLLAIFFILARTKRCVAEESKLVYANENATSSASSPHTFVMINGGSHFFDPAEIGWEKRCHEIGVKCEYYRKLSTSGCCNCSDYQAQVLQELMTRGADEIDGIAMAPCDGYELAPYIKRVVEEAGIPVVLYDTESANSSRVAYVGTDNYFMGVTMAQSLKQLRPEGGNLWVFYRGQYIQLGSPHSRLCRRINTRQ